MVMPIVIGVAGTHSTGKTTFCDELQKKLKSIGISSARVPSFGMQAAEARIPMLRDHTYLSTRWFVEKTIEAQLEAMSSNLVVLVDRPVPDCLAYWHAALESRGEIPADYELANIYSLVSDNLLIYTHLVATNLDRSIALAPGRDNDECFRASVDRYIHQILQNFGAKYDKLNLSNRRDLLCRFVDEIKMHLERK